MEAVELSKRIDNVEKDLRMLTGAINGKLEAIWTELRRLAQRPPWWATLVMTAMGTCIGAMGMWILNHLEKGG